MMIIIIFVSPAPVLSMIIAAMMSSKPSSFEWKQTIYLCVELLTTVSTLWMICGYLTAAGSVSVCVSPCHGAVSGHCCHPSWPKHRHHIRLLLAGSRQRTCVHIVVINICILSKSILVVTL